MVTGSIPGRGSEAAFQDGEEITLHVLEILRVLKNPSWPKLIRRPSPRPDSIAQAVPRSVRYYAEIQTFFNIAQPCAFTEQPCTCLCLAATIPPLFTEHTQSAYCTQLHKLSYCTHQRPVFAAGESSHLASRREPTPSSYRADNRSTTTGTSWAHATRHYYHVHEPVTSRK